MASAGFKAAPDALTDGFFVKNEGVNVGVGSFTIMNFIGTRSGGDLVNATVNPNNSYRLMLILSIIG